MSSGHGHGHSHQHGDGLATLRSPRTTQLVLGALVGAMALAALLGVLVTWPDHAKLDAARPADINAGVDYLSGTVVSTATSKCAATSEDRLPDGSVPTTATCVTATVRIEGDRQVQVPVPPEVKKAGLGDGDKIRLAHYPATADGTPETYAWQDHDRRTPLVVLAVLFVVGVLAVARFKGLASIAGLVLAYPTITAYMLPALRAGSPPVVVAFCGSALIMTVVLYLAHGVSTKTTVALLGTLAGLALTTGMAAVVTAVAHLDGLSNQENYEISRLAGGVDLSGIVLCGVIIAGLGVLNDVTVTQASAVWELRTLAPHEPAGHLFTSGMRIGRDHLASTVYTIAFAYAGAGLPALMLIDLYQQPVVEVLNGGVIAEEIVRTLVGALGLVLTIPVTTVLAVVVARRAHVVEPQRRSGRHA